MLSSSSPRCFGDFIPAFAPTADSLELIITPASHRLKQCWNNHRLAAHFLADYLVNTLPWSEHEQDEAQRLQQAKGTISYIANELMENAMKFHLETSRQPVRLGVHILDVEDWIAVIFATNTVDSDRASKLTDLIQILLTHDSDTLYVQQVEHSVQESGDHVSGLGLLSMMTDYQARLGWRFTPLDPTFSMSEVMAMAQVKL